MDLHILPFLAFFSIFLVVSQAIPSPEIYWKKMLPNTKMPNAVKLSLPKTGNEDMVHLHDKSRALTGDTNVDVGPVKGVGVDVKQKDGGRTKVGVGWGGVIVNAGPKDKPQYVKVAPSLNPFDYRYKKSELQQQQPGRSLFFLQRDMKFGNSMKNLHFGLRTNDATFLPREKADSIPFSFNKLPSILREFEVEPESEEAKIIEETITGCKDKGIQGEEKYCATSLESLVDYVKNTLGLNVKAMSTEAKIIGSSNNVQNYTISAMKKVAGGDNNEVEATVCHKQSYAYAVFYCHKTKGTSAYMVSLMSPNGSKARAMAICHKDTSAWNPQHLAFRLLNVKPGTAPICHFLPQDHIVWVSN
ncbi:BURP domain protein RD22 [Spinacia oleracea]|uniref:BURP domain protein RD22 n=1 Tax=Spinacia oleracea TaxID=3562 RepID=A0A9R0JFL0_SPIOL|nr:BURP domain protein RD22-like [Spinacia oleracea]